MIVVLDGEKQQYILYIQSLSFIRGKIKAAFAAYSLFGQV